MPEHTTPPDVTQPHTAPPPRFPECPPAVWPDNYARLAGIRSLGVDLNANAVFGHADLISALIVGPASSTVDLMKDLLAPPTPRRIVLLLVVFPAGPTRQQHLRALLDLQRALDPSKHDLTLRVWPISREYGDDYEHPILPPTVIQAHDSDTGRTVMRVGSVGDLGGGPIAACSLNFVFQPDQGLRNAWRLWFEYALASSALLTPDSAAIPHLVPAEGDRSARELWDDFRELCSGKVAAPVVNPTSGEVERDATGAEVIPWDDGKTALDPLAKTLQDVFSSGALVTIDEATRIKPLKIPVRAALLGQEAEREVGAVTQTQAFRLKVLDDAVDKKLEKCRSIQDALSLLTYSLSQGVRWIPDEAKAPLAKELAARNEAAHRLLKDALGGKSVDDFVNARANKIRQDLNQMYELLGQGKVVPPDRVSRVLEDVRTRLTRALSGAVAPRAVYNRLAPLDINRSAPDDNWRQSLILLEASARRFREYASDPYFPRRFSGLAITEADFRSTCDVFGDVALDGDRATAARELIDIDRILQTEESVRVKCQRLWDVIKGARRSAGGK